MGQSLRCRSRQDCIMYPGKRIRLGADNSCDQGSWRGVCLCPCHLPAHLLLYTSTCRLEVLEDGCGVQQAERPRYRMSAGKETVRPANVTSSSSVLAAGGRGELSAPAPSPVSALAIRYRTSSPGRYKAELEEQTEMRCRQSRTMPLGKAAPLGVSENGTVNGTAGKPWRKQHGNQVGLRSSLFSPI